MVQWCPHPITLLPRRSALSVKVTGAAFMSEFQNNINMHVLQHYLFSIRPAVLFEIWNCLRNMGTRPLLTLWKTSQSQSWSHHTKTTEYERVQTQPRTGYAMVRNMTWTILVTRTTRFRALRNLLLEFDRQSWLSSSIELDSSMRLTQCPSLCIHNPWVNKMTSEYITL